MQTGWHIFGAGHDGKGCKSNACRRARHAQLLGDVNYALVPSDTDARSFVSKPL